MWPEHVWAHEGIREIDRYPWLQRPNQEFDHRSRAFVGLKQIPSAIDHDCRKGLLLRQHVVDGLADRGKRLCAEVGLGPNRRISGSQQELIGLPERNVECRRKAKHHLAAWLGAAELQETNVALRAASGHGQLKLREAAPPAPPSQARREGRRDCHNYLTSS